MAVKLHREGANIIVALFLILAMVSVTAFLFIKPIVIPWIVASVSLLAFLLVLNFFRSPLRDFKGDREGVVVSSADGTVVALEEVFEDKYLHSRAIQISVFMTVFNVHANWYPVDGTVECADYSPGRFRAAYLPKSSSENEHSSVVIKTTSGHRVLMRQIAGAIARRIVTYAYPGCEANISSHMGFIKFGSRIDIYLPADSKILVKIGDKTTGGITPIAYLNKTQE